MVTAQVCHLKCPFYAISINIWKEPTEFKPKWIKNGRTGCSSFQQKQIGDPRTLKMSCSASAVAQKGLIEAFESSCTVGVLRNNLYLMVTTSWMKSFPNTPHWPEHPKSKWHQPLPQQIQNFYNFLDPQILHVAYLIQSTKCPNNWVSEKETLRSQMSSDRKNDRKEKKPYNHGQAFLTKMITPYRSSQPLSSKGTCTTPPKDEPGNLGLILGVQQSLIQTLDVWLITVICNPLTLCPTTTEVLTTHGHLRWSPECGLNI